MKRRLREETVIFVSVLKWLILATIVGVIVGVSTTGFVELLHWGARLGNRFHYYFLFMPIAFLLAHLLTRRFLPGDPGCGTQAVIESVHKYSGKIKIASVPLEYIGTFLTVTFGGSVGKEGPSARIGAGLSSILADILRMDGADRRKLVICGISSGFASVFGTPIAGAIFGLEVLSVGSILYDVLLPSFVAGIISHQVSSYLGLTYFYHPINFVPVFSEGFFFTVVVSGIFFGFCGFMFIEFKKLGKKLSRQINLPSWQKALGAGCVLVLLTFLFSNMYLGLGLETIESALAGDHVPWYAFIIKAIFTSITLNFGGSGGVVTPIFFVGATVGNTFGRIVGADPAMFAAIGIVALLAGSANTPIAASILAVELFGPAVAPYAAVAGVISFVITGHRSVYPSQILAIKKSASIEVELGKELEKIKPIYHQREKSLIHSIEHIWKVAWRITSKK